MNKYLKIEQDIYRMAEMYINSTYAPARECYVEYVDIIIDALDKDLRYPLRNLWGRLIEEK